MASITLKLHCLFRDALEMPPAQIHSSCFFPVGVFGQWLAVVPLTLWVQEAHVNCYEWLLI